MPPLRLAVVALVAATTLPLAACGSSSSSASKSAGSSSGSSSDGSTRNTSTSPGLNDIDTCTLLSVDDLKKTVAQKVAGTINQKKGERDSCTSSTSDLSFTAIVQTSSQPDTYFPKAMYPGTTYKDPITLDGVDRGFYTAPEGSIGSSVIFLVKDGKAAFIVLGGRDSYTGDDVKALAALAAARL